MDLKARNVPRARIEQLRQHYHAALFDDVVPWWLKHSLDREHGGYYTMLARDGRPYAGDKHMWMNAREIWMFSHLFNTCQRKPEWLDAAALGVRFLLAHAFKDDGKMHFRLTREGRSLSEALSVYTEVFGSIALAEYSKAAGDAALWERAMRMYDFLMPRLGRPSDTALLCYPIRAEFHLHSHDMCRITVAWVFNQLARTKGDSPHLCEASFGPLGQMGTVPFFPTRFEDDLSLSVESIVRRHWKPELRALLENVAMDGSPMLDLPEGRMFHPGHAIESAWMLLEIARHRQDEKLVETAVEIILAALEHGWDKKYGGILYLTNIDWTPTHELEANLKLWWPHSEALYATLLGWSLTGRADLWQWYEKVHDYTFSHFPDPEYGEWYGYLDRSGEPVWTAKASGWKCFFHLPRALLRCWRVLEELA